MNISYSFVKKGHCFMDICEFQADTFEGKNYIIFISIKLTKKSV